MSKPDHLRYAGATAEIQRAALRDITRAAPILMAALRDARQMQLDQWWIVSGAIYNQVWNHLTGRPEMTGVKDIDLFYFDPDTSYEAEDRQIKRAETVFAPHPPVELRNQARVHLWYEKHFGTPCPPYHDTEEPIRNFASRTHSVGLRLLPDDQLKIYAPYGLDDIFGFRVTPNALLANRATHEAKAARQKLIWPELTITPWPDT
ncbi:MAG: nucleotidyltransferase family protein [Rhodobacteraceae bacterium]|nr:nucleotidyltransferase family protein [Paracoccaceae bacterium]